MGFGLKTASINRRMVSVTVEGLLYVMLGRPEYCDLSRKIFLDTPCIQGKQEDSYHFLYICKNPYKSF